MLFSFYMIIDTEHIQDLRRRFSQQTSVDGDMAATSATGTTSSRRRRRRSTAGSFLSALSSTEVPEADAKKKTVQQPLELIKEEKEGLGNVSAVGCKL